MWRRLPEHRCCRFGVKSEVQGRERNPWDYAVENESAVVPVGGGTGAGEILVQTRKIAALCLIHELDNLKVGVLL